MEEEIWKDIPDYEGLYQVSNFGNIKSLKRYVKHTDNNLKLIKERICKPLSNKKYYAVALSKNGKYKQVYIHKLVAICFLNHKPDKTNKIVVDHINNNSFDNTLKNLQLITNRENLLKNKKNKTSKYRGVYWFKKTNKWGSKIYINGKNINLGYFLKEDEAYLAYKNKLKELC